MYLVYNMLYILHIYVAVCFDICFFTVYNILISDLLELLECTMYDVHSTLCFNQDVIIF